MTVLQLNDILIPVDISHILGNLITVISVSYTHLLNQSF